MGAWGYGSFDNDTALDWLGDLDEGDASLVGETLDVVGEANEDEYIDADDACNALAAAELVAAALGRGEERLKSGARKWLEKNRDAVRGIGAARAKRAVSRVFESSELRELWDENGEDTEWHTDVRELLSRLS
jgi:hypothetical protein